MKKGKTPQAIAAAESQRIRDRDERRSTREHVKALRELDERRWQQRLKEAREARLLASLDRNAKKH
jgi:hypothetical protein